MNKIKEIIVVEGPSDTRQIKKAVNADTLETHGSALSSHTIQLIKKLSKQRGVIVFTDPDFSGEKIRKTIAKFVPGLKHAFLSRAAAAPPIGGHPSLGIEHAKVTDIKQALNKAHKEEVLLKKPVISKTKLIDADLLFVAGSRERRARLSEILGIGYVNGKQLQKRLEMFSVSIEDFAEAVKKLNQEDKK